MGKCQQHACCIGSVTPLLVYVLATIKHVSAIGIVLLIGLIFCTTFSLINHKWVSASGSHIVLNSATPLLVCILAIIKHVSAIGIVLLINLIKLYNFLT